MIEHQVFRESVEGEYPKIFRIVARFWNAFSTGGENNTHRVSPRVPLGVGICMKLPQIHQLHSRFLPGFPYGSRLEAFAVVDETSGDGPA